jgi:hypothetical protein
MWLRILALTLILVITVGLGVKIEENRPSYVESATVLFTTPNLDRSAELYTWQAQSLISAGSVVSQILMSPQVEHEVAQAGGAGHYNLALINFYNQEYPEYGYPEATLSASSPDATSTHRTYLIAERTMIKVLATWQSQAKAPPHHRITAQVSNDSGPMPRSGSRLRALGGLLLLCLVAAGTCWSVTGRRASAELPG